MDNTARGLAVAASNSVLLNPAHSRLYVGLFGDSITQNGVYCDVVGADGISPPIWFDDGSQGATNNLWRAWGWASWLGPISMQRIQVVKSWAVQSNGLLCAGTTPAGWPLASQVTLALADPLWSRVNRAIIMIGTNDALQASGSLEANLAELDRQVKRLGKPVDLIAPPPNSSAPTQSTGDSMVVWTWLLAWRASLKRYADANPGRVRLIDGYSIGNTPTTTPDGFASGHALSDNIHPNNVYAFKIADAYVSATISSSLSNDLDIWPHQGYAGSTGANNKVDQGFVNPLFGTASGGTGTGTVAGSLTITNTGTAAHSGSVAACTITGGIGNMQSVACTSGAAGDTVTITGASVHASGGTFLAAGDRAWAQALVRVNSGGIFPRNLYLRLNGFRTPTNYYALLFEVDSTKEAALPLSGRTLLLRTPLFTMPSGGALTNLQASIKATFAAAGSCTIDIAHFEVRRFRTGTVQ